MIGDRWKKGYIAYTVTVLLFLQLMLGPASGPSNADQRIVSFEMVGALTPIEEYDNGRYLGMFPLLVQNTGDENGTGTLNVTVLPGGWQWSLVEGQDILKNVSADETVRATVQIEALDPLPGTHGILVTIEPGGTFIDLDATVPFIGGLKTISPTTANVTPGKNVTLSVEVTNKANGPDTFSISVLLPNADWEHRVLPQPVSPTLEVDMGHTWNVELDIPVNTPASIVGKSGYQVLFMIRSATDPDVNALNITQIHVSQFHGLGITPVMDIVGIGPEGLGVINVMVENLGNGPQDVEISLDIGKEWELQFLERTMTLYAFERKQATIYVSPLVNEAAGTQMIGILAKGPNCGPATAEVQVTVQERHGLSLVPIDVLGDPGPGEVATVDLQIMNKGNHFELVEMVPGQLPDGWRMTFTPSLISVPHGMVANVTATVLVSPEPVMAIEGRHDLKAVARSLSNGTGASADFSVDVRPVPSLEMIAETPVISFNPVVDPAPVHIIQVRNTGNSEVTTSISLLAIDDWASPSRGAISVGPGEVGFLHITLSPPAGARPGDHTFTIITDHSSVDIMATILERDVSITGLQHRREGSMRWSKDTAVPSDQRIEVQACLNDIGTDSTGRVDVALVLDGKIAELKENLVIGSNITLIEFDTKLSPGRHNVTVIAWAPGEFNDDDNSMTLMVEAGPAPALVDPGVAVAGATITTMTVLLIVILTHEGWKFKVLLVTLVPLFTRIKKETTLDNFTRGRIYGYVEANPGEHYNSIKKALNIPNGSLAYHLRTLEREGFVKFHMDGTYKRVYPKHMRLPKDEDGRLVPEALSKIQKIILDKVKDKPGMSQRQVARELNLAPSTINYNVRMLAMAGILRIERNLGRSRCYCEDDLSCAEGSS